MGNRGFLKELKARKPVPKGRALPFTWKKRVNERDDEEDVTVTQFNKGINSKPKPVRSTGGPKERIDLAEARQEIHDKMRKHRKV